MFNLLLTVIVSGLFVTGGIVSVYLAYRFLTVPNADGFKALVTLFGGSLCIVLGVSLPMMYFIGTILLVMTGK